MKRLRIKNLREYIMATLITFVIGTTAIRATGQDNQPTNHNNQTEAATEAITAAEVTTHEATTETEPETTTEAQEPETEEDIKYEIPLEEELQDYIRYLCEILSIEPELAFAMIQQESNYNEGLIGDGGDSFGLMQVQPQWHHELMYELGCTELLNPYDNVTVGLNILADFIAEGKGIEYALMAYNGGADYAEAFLEEGKTSDYAKSVLAIREQIKRR